MARSEAMHRPCPEDRLTILPDVIRLHILSLLPRKSAIRTGVLSSQWRNLWKFRFPHHAALRFDKNFTEGKTENEVISQIDARMQQLREQRIEVFNLYFYPGKSHQNKVSAWIQQAVQNGAEEFNLDFSQGKIGKLPGRLQGRRGKYELKEKVFRGNKLDMLGLRYCKLNRNFGFKLFRNLEGIYLHGVNINDSMLQRLVVNCPQLGRMDLRECGLLKEVRIKEPLSRLKSLVLVCCYKTRVVEIAAPMLKTLRFVGGYGSLRLMNSMVSLVDVIMISGVDERLQRPRNWLNLLLGINGVQVLTLCSKGLQFIFGQGSFSSCRLPLLKELQLILDENGDDPMEICGFFKRCFVPQLQRLFIELPGSYNKCGSDYRINLRPGALDPQFELLKIVRFNGFKKHYKETQLLKFILEKAGALEQLLLVVPHEHDMDICREYAFRVITGEVLMLPKASPAAELVWLCSSKSEGTVCSSHAYLPTKFA